MRTGSGASVKAENQSWHLVALPLLPGVLGELGPTLGITEEGRSSGSRALRDETSGT